MAGNFEVAIQAPSAAAGSPICMLQNTGAPGSARIRLAEFGLTTNAATLSQVGLVRALTIGTPSGIPAPGQPDDDLDTTVPVGKLVNGWSIAPTIAGTPYYLRQLVAAAQQGSGIVWTWPSDRPIVISPGDGLLLWNFGSGNSSALTVYAAWEE